MNKVGRILMQIIASNQRFVLEGMSHNMEVKAVLYLFKCAVKLF